MIKLSIVCVMAVMVGQIIGALVAEWSWIKRLMFQAANRGCEKIGEGFYFIVPEAEYVELEGAKRACQGQLIAQIKMNQDDIDDIVCRVNEGLAKQIWRAEI